MSGKFGSVSLAATTNTTVATFTTDASISINITNRTATAIKIRLAIGANATPVDADWINYDLEIPANGILERTGQAVSSGEMVVAYASAEGISVRVHGFEEIV
jgi:hypothetical protein